MRKTGHYEQLSDTHYFIPDQLPPHNPPLMLDTETTALYGSAMLQLGKINGMANKLPDIQRFIKAYVIKEALLSSAIEGIHTTLLDVLTQPLLESKPNPNTQLVMNYTKALDTVLFMLQQDGLPITSRVILAAHKALMELGEGDKADPGHYRRQSACVGNLIPAPPFKIAELMADLERYINTDETLPPLIKAGLAHVQFETIHPFLDRNGRIGRLLIVLILVESGLVSAPIIYPSYYFKKHRLEYYQRLDRVRTHGDFEGWVTFYLTAIKESGIDAYRRAKDIEALDQDLRQRIINEKRFSKMHKTMLRALMIIFRYPIINVRELSLKLNMSYNTTNRVIADFVQLGFLVEENQQKRGKLFKFKPYIDVLEQEYN